MGLLTTEIEVHICGKNIKHYEDLGYNIPKSFNPDKKYYHIEKDTKIKVRCKDLSHGSTYRIKVQCDCCNKIYFISYQDYYQRNHNGEIYCHKCAMKLFNTGENNYLWNSNITKEEREEQRSYPEYVKLVKKVMTRDQYICKICGGHKSGDLIVHHLNGYNWCKEGRLDEKNCITLCQNCHGSFHSIYGYGNNTKEQFEQWTGKALNELKKYEGKLPTTRKVYCIDDNITIDSVMQYSKQFSNKSACNKIYACCNKKNRIYKGKHYLWLDEYEKMTEEQIKNYLVWCNTKDIKRPKGGDCYQAVSVICLTTNEVFNCMTDAAKKYNTQSTNIRKCLIGKRNFSGRLPDGTLLKWMKHKDYLEQIDKIKIKKED